MKLNILFLTLSLIAENIGTIGGFGSSVFFVPIANFYFDFETVLGLTALFHVASNLSKITLFRKGIDIKLFINLGIPAIIFVVIGGLLSKFIEGVYLEIILGIFLIILSSLFLIKHELFISASKKNSIIGGSLSGLLAGLLGTGGTVRGLTMAAFNLEKSVFVATSAVIDFGVDFTRSFVYFFNGYINTEVLKYIPFLVLIGWCGTWIGKKILYKVPQSQFKKTSLSFILFIGIITLLNQLNI